MKLCSACLLGIKCRYDCKSKPDKRIVDLAKKETLIPVCPEQLGGLPTPRPAQELQGCSGEKVLGGEGKVKNIKGKDVTEEFIRGAEQSLMVAELYGIKKFIGKSKSPSCGCGKVYNGSFTGKLAEGDGVTTALFKMKGIKVITEEGV